MATTGKGLPRSLKSASFSVSWTEVTGKPTTFAPVPATLTVVGGVKKTAAVADIATQTVTGADAAAAAAAVATSATTAVNAVGTKLNALLAALRTAGITTP